MAVTTAIVRAASNTANGNQDITDASFGGGTPKACIVLWSECITTGTAIDGARGNYGFATGASNQGCASWNSEHADAVSTDTRSELNTDRIINGNTFGSSGAYCQANFVSFLTNGIRINWIAAPSIASLMTVILLGGDDLQAHADNYALGAQDSVVDTTAPGFQPNVVLSLTVHANVTSAIRMGNGFAWDDVGITQHSWATYHDNGGTPTDISDAIFGSFGGGLKLRTSATPQWALEFSDFDASGFTTTVRVGAATGANHFYMALDFGPNEVFLGPYVTPVATGDDAEVLGFKPQLVLLTFLEEVTAFDTMTRGGTEGYAAFNETSEFCHTTSDEDGVTPPSTNTQSLSSAKALDVPDGAGTLESVATLAQFDAAGYTLNYTTVPSTQRAYIQFAIEEDAAVAAPGAAVLKGIGDLVAVGTDRLPGAASLTGSGDIVAFGSTVPNQNIGYKITASGGATNYQHTGQKHSFFGPNNTWWCLAQDNTANDWALWEWDGTFPVTPGTPGSWSIAQLVSGGGNLYVDNRDNDAVPSVYYEDGSSELHVFAPNLVDGVEFYNLYSYNSGTNDWTHDVTNEITGPDVNTDVCSLTVDSNGKVWVLYIPATGGLTLVAAVRADGIAGAWTTSAEVLEPVATLAITESRVSVVAWDNGGVPSIGVFYSWDITGGDKWRFAYRADSDADGAAWTFEDVDIVTTIDNHADVAAALLDSDTVSTIIACGKDASDNMVAWRRNPAGTWSAVSVVAAVGTRPHAVIDSTNAETYISYHPALDNSKTFVFRKSAANAALSFGAVTTMLEIDDGAKDFRKSHGAPAGNGEVTSTTNLLYLAESSPDPWWNIINLGQTFAAIILKARGGNEMGAIVQRRKFVEITSGAARVESAPFLLGGNSWEVQFKGPDPLAGIEGSNDLEAWNVMTDLFNTAISAKTGETVVGLERPKWLRTFVAIDAGQPQVFSQIINVQKQQGS